MNADVEKAVERIDHRVDYFRPIMETDWHTIRQALRDQDAEIARLRNVANEYNQCIRHMSGGGDFFEFQRDITAHLGGEHE